MARSQSAAKTDDYAIRHARPADRDGFLSLYEAVWGRSRSEAWFDWRFERNPYAGGVEMVVAERAGELVGAQPLLALPLASGSTTVAARQPVDWFVHPDHRRRGLFTRMTEQLLSAYEDRAALLFNFPSEALQAGLRQFDWTTVGEVATRYRVHDPQSLARQKARGRSTTASLLGRVGRPVARVGLGVVDRLSSSSTAVSVDRVDGVAVDDVRAVYTATRPDVIHVPREAAFLEWRFANPRWETTTYVARDGGDPRATVVIGTETVGEATVGLVLDVQPMTTDSGRAPAFAAALDAALEDFDVDVVKAPAAPFPSVLTWRGFLRDDRFPLSAVASPRPHVVRPLGATGCDELDRDPLDGDNWLLSLADRDIE